MKPRPPLLFTLAYGAGLATGLWHFGTPLVALPLLGAALAGRQAVAVAPRGRRDAGPGEW